MQLVRKRINSRNEQYTQGRFRKYVQTKKRKTNVGDAFVGINRSGSQLKREKIIWSARTYASRSDGRCKAAETQIEYGPK